MASTSLTELVYSLRTEVPGCLDSMILSAIVQSARELFRKSRIWTFTSDEIVFSPTLAEYDIEPESGTDLIEIESLKQDGLPVLPKSQIWLDANIPNWKTSESSRAKYFTMVGRRTFRVTPIPTEVSLDIDLRVSLTLPRDATSLDEDIYDEWNETIAAGALYRLLGMTGVKWANKSQSADNEQQFYRDIAEATVRANRSNAPSVGSVQMRPIA